MAGYKSWSSASNLGAREYTCGYCDRRVASDRGFMRSDPREKLMICPNCGGPTYLDVEGGQTPGASYGVAVGNVPEEVNDLYSEARGCIKASLFTAAVLVARKLLMNIAVDRGASDDLRFIQYVEYLVDEGYAPPGSGDWVDHIRKRGNEANHEIMIMTKEVAVELVAFIEMLLKFIYEFPARVVPPSTDV